ncbi:hypothetical protein AB0L70_29590 [Kribbella sp. NPDC051952]
MAEPVVDDLVRDMYERVARHTGGTLPAELAEQVRMAEAPGSASR